MLEHLIDALAADFVPPIDAIAMEPTPVNGTVPSAHLNAAYRTAEWLEEMGVTDDGAVLQRAEREAAALAFTSITNGHEETETHQLLTRLDTPPAVKHLVGMLTAYDWQFVERAQELRGYCVAQILEETKHADAKIRLKALEMLGKVTEVALFTERMEIKRIDVSDGELNRKIEEKLKRLNLLEDVEIIPDTPAHTIETPPVNELVPSA